MALIKCSECGKDISDKATTCIHCGCPIEKEEKIFCIECGNELKTNDKVCKKCGCPTEENKNNNLKNDDEEIEIIRTKLDEKQIKFYANFMLIFAIIFVFPIITIFFSLICLFFYIWFRQNKKAYLVLTNKRIYGSIKRGFTTFEIDLPLDKVSSITKSSSMKQQNITIETTGSTKYTISYVKNVDEFRKEFLKLKK